MNGIINGGAEELEILSKTKKTNITVCFLHHIKSKDAWKHV